MPLLPFGSPPVVDASSSKKGKVQLAGDLAGTAAVPTIKSSVSLSGSPTTTTQSAGDNSTKIATDQFVTTAIANAIAGVNPADAVAAATTSASDTSSYTYNNGVGGVGATLTGLANTALTVDGFTYTTLGQELLVKNDTQSPSGAFNGIYGVTQLQTLVLPLILTRASDYNSPSNINGTGAIPVVNGTANHDTSWILTSSITTMGTSPILYQIFTLNPSTIITTTTSAGGDLTGTYPNPTLAAVVTGTTVGSATQIPVLTYNNKGQVTGSTTASPTASTQRTFAFWRG